MRRRFLILLLMAMAVVYARGQNRTIDSLSIIVERTSAPKERVNILNELASAWFHYDMDRSYELSRIAENDARKINYANGISAALVYQGLVLADRGQFKEGLIKYREAERLQDDQELKAYIEVLIGSLYQAIARYDSSEFFYKRSIDRSLKLISDKYLAYAYKNIGRLYALQWRNEEAENYFTMAIDLYKTKKNKVAIAETNYYLSDIKKNQGEFERSNALIEQSCQIGQELGGEDDQLNLYCEMYHGEIHFQLGDYEEALQHYLKGLQIFESLDLPSEQSRLLKDLGDIYEVLGQNEIAAKYYLESLKLAEKIGIKYEVANVRGSIYFIYKNQKNFRKAHEYIDSSIEIRTEINDQYGLAKSYNGKGLIYLDETKYDSALIYFERGLKIFRQLGSRLGISSATFNKGRVMERLGRYTQAIDLYKSTLPIEEDIQDPFNLCVSYNTLASAYLKSGALTDAFDYLKKATAMANRTQSKALHMENSLYWSEYYKKVGDFKQALFYRERYSIFYDSIYSSMSAGKLAELEALYQLEKKDNEILLLNRDKELKSNEIKLQQSKINQQTILLTSIILVLILVSVLAILSGRYNKRMSRANREITEQKEEIQAQSEELIEANATIANINKDLEEKIQHRTEALTQAYKELDTFFYRSSHDFRRPLTTFLGLAEVANITVKDPNALELFDKVKETAINLDKMLVKLQSISDVGSQQLVYKEVFLKEIIDNITNDFREEIQKRNIKIQTDIRLHSAFVSYPAMVKTVIENLVENAIQFSNPDKPFIKFTAYDEGQYITIDIQDNGQGIPKEYQEQIFDMYFRGSERSKGNGLGLYIVKKAVEKLEGSITMSSIVGAGSTFTIMLPNKLK